ncbi:DUF2787 domain-containing protein [Vibrio diabolicus]|uniref:DUF2787 domain-containing protein n=1 Tax=Vibrio diabolicus TaxID=50719 RepID=UPI00215EF6E1|nr:DUF2787 domain-containing protein [Vibrio diabolicus]MCS0307436.1 DUF2787 domain-containing protein [Vibrio diabolicus]
MSILNFTPSVLPVSNKLLTLLNQHCHASMESTQSTSHALSIHFRDKSYSAEEGGYHPVEIGLNIVNGKTVDILYITDFAYMGSYYPELERCIDFGNQVAFTVATGWQSIRSPGIDELYQMWEQNFLQYVEWECYDDIQISY